MAKITKEKFYDAIQNDWEMDFIINKIKYHYEREFNSDTKILIQLYECGKNEDIFNGYRNKNSDYLNEILDLTIPKEKKPLRDCIDDIEIEFETLSK